MRLCHLLLLGVLVLSGCRGDHHAEESARVLPNSATIADGQAFHAEGFSLVLPDSVVTDKQSPVEDFDIYRFKMGDDLILSAYAGNQPSFPPDQAKGKPGTTESASTIHGCRSQKIVFAGDTGQIESHILVQLRKQGWPEFVHFWYPSTTPGQTSLAEKIVSSVKPE